MTYNCFYFCRNGTLMSESTHMLNTYDNRFHPLAVTIKYWGKVNRVVRKPGFSNHMLTMLLISYLQTNSVLPPLTELYVDNCKYHRLLRFVNVC